jgi:alkylation response protein AidB-like acyl-CoA dehydrogenase
VLIVDTKDPGYSWTPIITSTASHHVNATYYNDVRVPATCWSARRTRAGG